MSKTPCLAASAVFALAALLIARLALAPLGAADLLGVAACAAAAGAAAALAFAVRPGARDDAALAEMIAAKVAEALAAAEIRREDSARRATTEAVPLSAPVVTVGEITPGAGKSRLGRGVAGLIQGTSFKPAPEAGPTPAAESPADGR